MSADLFSSFLGMTLQATGNNNNVWGTILNGSALQIIERRLSGNTSHAVTGGTLDLSGTPPPAAVSQVLDLIQMFTGTLTANQIVILPNLSGYWKFVNKTTGAFQLLLQTPSGTFINIPQGCSRGVTCDGAGNLLRDDRDQVGNFEYNAVSNAGTVAANGASLLKTDFPDLFAKFGTTFGTVDSTHFTLPLLTDTGRFLRSTTSSLTVGTYQSNLLGTHTHTVTGAPSAGSLGTDSQGSHSHGVTDPTHSHTVTPPGEISANTAPIGWVVGINSSPSSFTVTTSASATGISIQSAGAHTHNVTGAPGLGSLGTASAGGSETRPEALAVAVSIRY